MKGFALALTLLMLITGSYVLGQTSEVNIQAGIYSVNLDWSTKTELNINNDQTFTYLDRNKFGSFTCSGTWTIRRGKLILFAGEKSELRPMPTKWKIKNDEVCGQSKMKKANWRCLTLQPKKDK